MVSHCCSSCLNIHHVWNSQRFARNRPANVTQAAAVHCSIERLFCRVQSTTPSSERSTMPKRAAVSHACMRVHWCHGASSKRRRHQMSLIITTTGSRCGLEKPHDADCAPPPHQIFISDHQAARFQQRPRYGHIVEWICRSAAAAAAAAEPSGGGSRIRRFRDADLVSVTS